MMKKIMKRMVQCIAALVLVLMATQMTEVKAKTAETISCGPNVEAKLEGGTLTIYGTGQMAPATYSPFWEYRDEIYRVVIEEGVTSIGSYSFEDFNRIGSVSISSTVTEIGDYAFYECSGLYEIDIPGNVENIGAYAFCSSNLNKCTFHKGLWEIGKGAFFDTKLKSIVIPDGINSIEESAFEWCYDLNSVTIPEHIDIIKANAFENVAADIYSKYVTIGEGAFGDNSVFTADRGSSADTYAKNHGLKINYRTYSSTVTFNPNGGSVSQKTKIIKSESVYGALPTPKRVGYAFKGWYTKASGGSQKKQTTKVTTTKNSTLYAHWEKINVAKCATPSITLNRGKKLTLRWTGLTGAKGYQIRYGTKSNMTSAKTTSSKTTTKTIKKLQAKKKYYIQVRAYKLDSAGKKVYGDWSNKKKVKVRK